MQIDQKIPIHDVRLLNADVIIRDAIKLSQLSCLEYSLDFNPLDNCDSRRIFINHFVVTLCDRIKLLRTSEKVILYINHDTYLLPNETRDKYVDLIVKIADILSIKHIIDNNSFESFIHQLNSSNHDSKYLFDKTYNKLVSSKGLTQFSYKKLATFLKANGLKFLLNTYFRDTRNKMIVSR
jgi:hypothetical protein